MPSRKRSIRAEAETNRRLAAAQYLRMSTEHQKYSTDNQAQAIAEYAAERGLKIVRTYEDLGRSGLRLEGRQGLQKLIADVQSGASEFGTVLVYDISRWGRFQDTDESAYYEYICKEAGISIHYCAEQFENDGSISATIIKSIKRAMAGEYSRELSAKVFAGQCRLIKFGFHQGGMAGYALRRQLLNERGEPKGLLKHGEYKNLTTDRVVLVPGPQKEVAVVRRIYRLFVHEDRHEKEIATTLNSDGISNALGRPWTPRSVQEVLTNEKYIGNNVYNRRSARLRQRRLTHPSSMWIRGDGAFEPIVDVDLFNAAKQIISKRTWKLSDEQVLQQLRNFLTKNGRLSASVIDEADELPSSNTYYYRFGRLWRAYELIGYVPPGDFRQLKTKQRQKDISSNLLADLKCGIERVGGVLTVRGDGLLTINDEFTASLIILPSRQTRKTRQLCWWIDFRKRPATADIVIVARMDELNSGILDFYLFPRVELLSRTVHFTPPTDARMASYRCETLGRFIAHCARETIRDVA